jgi:DNA-directed RNA polymerase specialized sigma24 family protein
LALSNTKETLMDNQSLGHRPAGPRQASAVRAGPAQPPQVRQRETGELLRRARAGDRAALDQIIERLTPLVWNVARAHGLDTEAASGIVQTTWIALMQDLHSIQSADALAGWLVRVGRRHARAMRADQPGAIASGPDPPAGLDGGTGRERLRCLWDNLRKLPPAYQEQLRILAFTEHASLGAVLDALDGPSGNAGPARGRCLNELRALLHDDPRWNRLPTQQQ